MFFISDPPLFSSLLFSFLFLSSLLSPDYSYTQYPQLSPKLSLLRQGPTAETKSYTHTSTTVTSPTTNSTKKIQEQNRTDHKPWAAHSPAPPLLDITQAAYLAPSTPTYPYLSIRLLLPITNPIIIVIEQRRRQRGGNPKPSTQNATATPTRSSTRGANNNSRSSSSRRDHT